MGVLKRKQKPSPSVEAVVQTRPSQGHPFGMLDQYVPLMTPENRLYEAMREAIPILDTALYKMQRLIGGFRLCCDNSQAEKMLNEFARLVPVGASSAGLESFVCSYLDSLLMYGTAMGEIVLSKDRRRIVGLYQSCFEDVVVQHGETPMSVQIMRRQESGEPVPVPMPQLILFSALNPRPGQVKGDSIFKSLPFVSSILLKIYQAIGQNFDRIGNIRFAVTYRPADNSMDHAYAKERAQQIAREWSAGMAASRTGQVQDFISVGDVDIKVIGAENQMIDCEMPARQMLEQIIAKLSVPPFILGISWSTTERMSQQQAQLLSAELAYYRRLLTPIILKICTTYLRLNGFTCMPTIEWDVLNFDDEIAAAQSRLYNAQAAKLEKEIGAEPQENPVDVSALV